MSKTCRALLLLVALAIPTSSEAAADIEIDSPAFGAFIDASGVEVTGTLQGVPIVPAIVTTVNGVLVSPNPDGTFAIEVAFDPDTTVQILVAETRFFGILLDRDAVSVVAGAAVLEEALAPDSLGVRLTEQGFAAAAPGLSGSLPMDLAELVPPGTVMFDDYCVLDGVLTCLAAIDVVISGSPPPSFGSLEVAVDPRQDFATVSTTVHDLFVRADVYEAGLIGSLPLVPPLCSVNFRAASAPIVADLVLEPDPLDAGRIDADLAGVQVGFVDFTTENDCTLGILFDLLLPILVGDVEALAVSGFEDFLRDPDGSGPEDSVLAELVGDALEQLDLAGSLGDGLMADVAVAFTAVDEDDDGLTLELDTQLTPIVQHPDAVDLTGSLLVPGPLPDFGPLTPGGQTYDLGLCLSSTLLNQTLKLQIEGGLLATEVTEAEFLGDVIRLDASVMSLFFPAFRTIPAHTPVDVRVRPKLAPILDGRPGPMGELANVEMGHILIEFMTNDTVQLAMAVSARVGIDLVAVEGALETRVSAPDTSNVRHVVLSNAIGEGEERLDRLIPFLVAFFFPSLANESVTRVELPELLGLVIDPKEITLVDTCVAVFGDFGAAPPTGS